MPEKFTCTSKNKNMSLQKDENSPQHNMYHTHKSIKIIILKFWTFNYPYKHANYITDFTS